MTAPPVSDQLGLRRANLALLLGTLRAHGPHSRAGLARRTGLTKATASSLVAELTGRGLVRLGEVAPGHGRPAQLVELRPGAVCGIGLEANVDYAALAVLDVAGGTIAQRRVAVDLAGAGYDRAVDLLAALAKEGLAATDGWVAGITVAVPGLVDVDHGVVRLAPNLGWREARLAEDLAGRLAGRPVLVDNDANLSALAEHAAGVAAGTPDLLYLTGEVGVGGGVIAGGALLRGATGFTGEVGHLPLDPVGLPCGCGRRGCWETQVGLAALLREVAPPGDPVADPATDLETRLLLVRDRAAAGDARTLAALDRIGTDLGVGASILVNVLNPAAVVLGGYFALLGEWLAPPARAELAARVLAPDCGGCRLLLSDLGFTAAVLGGAHAALDRVFADPTLAPTDDSDPDPDPRSPQ
ncbi:ROK family transcriptional regulator [Solihabitans fulvus]|uniref:ROK family transcriptional regulator n=1 Tax=Solihabitans fulvus TaxID=1892852 RepID=A0A5B2WKH2_9PSEU|nr:ROK family transcriptional regulator [Solihabitans fulvus]KAA2251192.1 ROK family transcriptional regulator [Solihabitans fulvus]